MNKPHNNGSDPVYVRSIYIIMPNSTLWRHVTSCEMASSSSTSDRPVNTAIKMPFEPVLDGVLDEDRLNVRNVIYVLHALNLCQSWSVTPKNKGYEIVGSVDTKINTLIEYRDLELLRKVDPLRINSAGINVIGGTNPTFSVVVFVLRKSEPVILEEQDIIRIQRKRKFWGGFGSGST